MVSLVFAVPALQLFVVGLSGRDGRAAKAIGCVFDGEFKLWPSVPQALSSGTLQGLVSFISISERFAKFFKFA